jgi:hypothetical protein
MDYNALFKAVLLTLGSCLAVGLLVLLLNLYPVVILLFITIILILAVSFLTYCFYDYLLDKKKEEKPWVRKSTK